MSVVTRFPPSPTGHLHVGGARTALYNWLFARNRGGRFLVRIEDTDRERSRDEFVDEILESLAWLGIDADGPVVRQSERLAAHRAAAERLLATGAAYECFCRPDDLDAKRRAAEAKGLAWRYDGTCRDLPRDARAARRAAGTPAVVRFRVPPGETAFDDAVRGRVTFDHAQLDDLIVLKADGTPTYNLAVVVDDAEAGVTDVIRGEDHISNTPKQILLQRALGLPTPRYAHLPLIHGTDGKRLSKRHGATAVREFRERGFLPEGLANYLALLGWSPGGDREVLSVREMVEAFSLERVGKRAAVFDHAKCEWMNGEHLKRTPSARLRDLLADRLGALDLSDERLAAWGVPLEREAWLDRIIDLVKVRVRFLPDVFEAARYFLEDSIAYDEEAVAKHGRSDRIGEILGAARAAIESVPAGGWTPAAIESAVRGAAGRLGVRDPDVMHPLRLAVTGRSVSPGLFETVWLVGRGRALRRVDEARARLAPVRA